MHPTDAPCAIAYQCENSGTCGLTKKTCTTFIEQCRYDHDIVGAMKFSFVPISLYRGACGGAGGVRCL